MGGRAIAIDYACTGGTRTTLRAVVEKKLFCRQYFLDNHEKSTLRDSPAPKSRIPTRVLNLDVDRQ
jgi:hypothetical protein